MTPDFSVFAGLFIDTLDYWWVILPATLLGILVGAIPGFSAANTIIILLPLTLAMEPVTSMVFMMSLYTASRLGAGNPATLVNIPGTAGAAATPLDGYPMATSGRAQQALAISKTPELYGTGHVSGLIAPESANNGVTSGTLIPLLLIGVPGGATAAIMAVVLEYHGVNFGPGLFASQPMIAYGAFSTMAVTYVLPGLLILPLTRYFSRVMIVPTEYMAPVLIAFTLVGSFVPRGYLFELGVAIAFGLIGYIARKTGYHVAAILIGVIPGPLLENYFLRALRISQGDMSVLFSSTIGHVLWALLILSLVAPGIKRFFRKGRKSDVAEE